MTCQYFFIRAGKIYPRNGKLRMKTGG